MLRSEWLENLTQFMGSIESYQDADVVILGVPLEITVSFRPGTRFGPQQIRIVSHSLEDYSMVLHKNLASVPFFDAGNLAFPPGDLTASLQLAEEAARQVFSDGKKPVFLGGEHLISLPLIKAAREAFPDLIVAHFDAHADLRSEYLGLSLSHATVMRRVAEIIGCRKIYQFGIRSAIREEIEYSQSHTYMYAHQVLEPLSPAIAEWDKRPVYLTLDIDVVDPAYAPGTGTPEPGGCTAREILQAVHLLQQANIVAIDLVEVSPPNDHGDLTSILAAKLIREIILGCFGK